MKLRDSVTISASALDVWPWVADPARIAVWNPQLIALDRSAEGEVRLGEQFTALYHLRRRERESRVEIVACQPPLRVVYRHRYTDQSTERHVDECFTLLETSGETRVEQTIDLSCSGIAWPWRMLIGLIFRVGRPVGERYLEQLRRLVEESGKRKAALPRESALIV